jgi:hypothetical protein
MSDYREQAEKAKLKKLGVIEQKENQGKAAKKKPYLITADIRFMNHSLTGLTIGKYARLQDALKAVGAINKIYCNIKLIGPDGEIDWVNVEQKKVHNQGYNL